MKLKKMLAAVLTMAMVATALPVTAFADDGINTAEELQAALKAAGEAGAGNTTIEITGDIDMGNVTWSPVKIDGYNGADIVTVNGNKHTIYNLKAPLFSKGFAGGCGIVINDLTIADSEIVSTNTTGSGAFMEYMDSMNEVTLNNCHLLNSSVTGSRTGGLIGWTSGYNKENDGPVKTYVTITNCSVIGCTITGSSVGAINGHAGANEWTYTTIKNCTIKNNELHSTDAGGWRVGVVVGTANVGEVVINNITESGNTLKQTGKTAPEGQTNLVGRFVPDTTGKLTIDGEKYGKDCKPVPTVAQIGNVKYETLAEAVAAAKKGNVITLLENTSGSGIVIDKSITIDFGTHTYTVKDNAVGSTGTKTIGFQILEGNKVTLKNGTLTESTANDGVQPNVVKMLIQNYADLTVEDMKLEGAGLPEGRYVLSNNCGNVVITGETYINAPENGIAVDAYDYSDGGYDGVTVTFDKDFVGHVNGALELDAADTDNANTKMIINSVNGGFKGNLDQKAGKLEISAGKFAANPARFVANGFVAVAEATLGYEVISADAYIPENPADVIQGTDADVPKAGVADTAVAESEVSTELTGGKTEVQVVSEMAVGLQGETGTLAAADTTSVLKTVAAAVPAPTVSELQQAGVDVESETHDIEVTVKPYMEVEVQSVVMTEEKKEIKLDIEAKYDVVVTQGSEVENEPIVEGAKLDVKEIWITIPLPDGFAAPNSKIYVAHIKEDANGNKYVADKYEATVSDDGKTARFFNENGFSEFLVSGTNFVAAIGDTTYYTLQAAVEDAGDGATIKLLGNTTGGGVKIPSGKNITIDFGGYTYKFDKPGVGSGTLTSNGFQILAGSTVTLKNGTLEVDSAMAIQYYTLIQNYADLTVDGMTLDGTNLDKWAKDADQETNGDSYVLSNNNGNVTITGNTTIIANDDGSKAFAFDVCDNDGYAAGVTVTIDEGFTGEIKGRIEVSDDDNEDGTTAELTIAGTGEFTSVPEIKTGVTADVEISSGIFGEEVPLDMLASDANRVTCADNSSVILTDADLASGAVGLVAGEKLVTDDGTVLLAVNKGAATYNNGIVSAEAGAEVMTENAGTVYFSNGGSIDASGKISYVPNYGGTTNKVIGGSKESTGTGTEGDAFGTIEVPKTLVLTIGQNTYQKDGVAGVNDVAPIIQGERTMLPIRLIAEFLGATVTWDETAQSVTITNDDTTIVIVIGLPYAMVNGERVELDAPAFISNDRTYLPVRFISENLGAEVAWDGVLKTVTIVG